MDPERNSSQTIVRDIPAQHAVPDLFVFMTDGLLLLRGEVAEGGQEAGMGRTGARLVPSSTFFGWVMQYKGEILIEKPAEVKKNYEKLLTEIMAKQQNL